MIDHHHAWLMPTHATVLCFLRQLSAGEGSVDESQTADQMAFYVRRPVPAGLRNNVLTPLIAPAGQPERRFPAHAAPGAAGQD